VNEHIRVIHELEAAVKVLCGRGKLHKEILDKAVIVMERQLSTDLTRSSPKAINEDLDLLNAFVDYTVSLSREQTEKGSPCAISR